MFCAFALPSSNTAMMKIDDKILVFILLLCNIILIIVLFQKAKIQLFAE